ncbi:Solute carrier family 15 member 1 [Astathelohania contejeani]|uniref:Solute carrier family 15 member 1 n=1 Tax=Astathelohania contejeani TaxID=164912 RepID=A0ABQ7I249_9MICR|nr:Solute carrier family 15 member 1 [Thelohania contejeani]
MLIKTKYAIFLILGNKFFERLCYYGLQSVLYTFLQSKYNCHEHVAKALYHLFTCLCYSFTLLGAFTSDALLGRYKSILAFSILYFIGMLLLIISSNYKNFIILEMGLFFIALGISGLKPNISIFGGDQFGSEEEKGRRKFFSVFSMSINTACLIGPIIGPMLTRSFEYGYSLVFILSTFFLALSIILFLIGSKYYIKLQANKQFYKKLWKFLKCKDRNDESLADRQIFIDTLKIIGMVTPSLIFWMMADQSLTTWVDQGKRMNLGVVFFGSKLEVQPPQLHAANAIFAMLLNPFFYFYLYPRLNKWGYYPNPLLRMGIGLLLSSLSFIFYIIIEIILEQKILSIFWQIPQYFILTAGEILLAITGLEFAYAESHEEMKGLVYSCWLMMVAAGNLFVAIFSIIKFGHRIGKISGLYYPRIFDSLFYSLLSFIGFIIFYIFSKNYRMTWK